MLTVKSLLQRPENVSVPFTVVGKESYVGYNDYVGEKIELKIREYLDLVTNNEVITEKDKDRRERRYFSGINLILYCLLFLLFIFVVDSITTIFCGVSSKTTNSIIEIIKALLFSLSGYLFARNENL